MKVVLPEFALSHFDATKHSPAIPGITPQEFIDRINREIPYRIDDGYAPFCKIMYYHNFTDAKVGIVPIHDEMIPFIQSGYEARRETELPVLVRWIDESIVGITASYLAVIVYDKEQMKKEGQDIDGDYAIVNILRLVKMEEPPIPPITMMRNALGVSEGGSGVPLDREAYMRSVEFWTNNVAVKPKAN
jgi:hypothetical protein